MNNRYLGIFTSFITSTVLNFMTYFKNWWKFYRISRKKMITYRFIVTILINKNYVFKILPFGIRSWWGMASNMGKKNFEEDLWFMENRIWRLIKNMLTRGKIATPAWLLSVDIAGVRRSWWKWIKCAAFSRHCGLHQLKRKTDPSVSWATRGDFLQTPAMSTDSSQVDVAIFPSC